MCWSTGQTPTISDYKTTDGTGPGSFVSSISGLSANTTYYVRAYATNCNGTAYGNEMSFTTLAAFTCGSIFTDTRNNFAYPTVQIGNQCWLAKNLAYLPSVVGPFTGSTTTPNYYVYDYDGTNTSDAKATPNYTTYGVLYNWPAAMNGAASSTANPSGVQGICPTGWHLPSDAEWTELTDYLGGTVVGGGKLKETGTTHWNTPNTGATNETGFTALQGGMRWGYDTFVSIGEYGYWWCATEHDSAYVYYWVMYNNYSDVDRVYCGKEMGFSVRCVRD